MRRMGFARHLCTLHDGHLICQPARASSNVPCEGMTAPLFHSRQLEASAGADGAVGFELLPDEMRAAHPAAVGGGSAHLDQEEAATGPAAVVSAGATCPVRAADELQPGPGASWLPPANPKTQRMESNGAGARAGSHPAETASQPASPKLAVLASDDIPWAAAKGSSSPGSMNNDSIGLGLIHEEEGAETQPSRSRFVCGPFERRASAGQPARDGADGLGCLVTHPAEGDDLGTPTSEAPSTVQTSAAEGLQGLRGSGRQALDHLNLVTGLPSQHGMTTRDPLKTDQAAEMLVHIRETGVREARHADDTDLETSEDSAGPPSARQTSNVSMTQSANLGSLYAFSLNIAITGCLTMQEQQRSLAEPGAPQHTRSHRLSAAWSVRRPATRRRQQHSHTGPQPLPPQLLCHRGSRRMIGPVLRGVRPHRSSCLPLPHRRMCLSPPCAARLERRWRSCRVAPISFAREWQVRRVRVLSSYDCICQAILPMLGDLPPRGGPWCDVFADSRAPPVAHAIMLLQATNSTRIHAGQTALTSLSCCRSL